MAVTPQALPARSPLKHGATLPLAFIAAGVLTSIAGTAWLLLRPDTLALPHLHMEVVALAHLWLLGVLLTICFGAVYQLLPVLANTPAVGERPSWIHLTFHLAGTGVMVGGFLAGDMAGVAAGGGSVGIGVLLFAVNVGRTLGATPRLDPVLLAFGCAAGWLVATVAAGVLLATNLHLGWWSLDTLAVLRAHAHAGVGGFFVTLLLGAMFRLVPMFALSAPPDLRRVGTSLALSQAGLVTLTVGLGTTRTAATLGGSALLVTAFFLAGVELRRLVVTRRKRAFEPGLIGFFAGLVCLALSTAVGVSFAIFGGDLPGALAYGVLAALGGVLATVQGMLCKIVPFLVWMRVYGPRVGRQPTPVASALGRPRFERAWVWLHMTATMLLTLGAWSVQRPLLVAGAVLFAIAQAALLTSLAASSRHLWPTVPTPARVAVATQRTS